MSKERITKMEPFKFKQAQEGLEDQKDLSAQLATFGDNMIKNKMSGKHDVLNWSPSKPKPKRSPVIPQPVGQPEAEQGQGAPGEEAQAVPEGEAPAAPEGEAQAAPEAPQVIPQEPGIAEANAGVQGEEAPQAEQAGQFYDDEDLNEYGEDGHFIGRRPAPQEEDPELRERERQARDAERQEFLDARWKNTMGPEERRKVGERMIEMQKSLSQGREMTEYRAAGNVPYQRWKNTMGQLLNKNPDEHFSSMQMFEDFLGKAYKRDEMKAQLKGLRPPDRLRAYRDIYDKSVDETSKEIAGVGNSDTGGIVGSKAIDLYTQGVPIEDVIDLFRQDGFITKDNEEGVFRTIDVLLPYIHNIHKKTADEQAESYLANPFQGKPKREYGRGRHFWEGGFFKRKERKAQRWEEEQQREMRRAQRAQARRAEASPVIPREYGDGEFATLSEEELANLVPERRIALEMAEPRRQVDEGNQEEERIQAPRRHEEDENIWE
jgi:hypothetical protein